MAITFNNTGQSVLNFAAPTVVTLTNLVKGATTNGLTVCGISVINDGALGARTITSVTNGSDTLVASGAHASVADDARCWVYHKIAPTAETANLVVTFNGALATGAVVGAIVLEGVDQTTPVTGRLANAADNDPMTLVMSSASDDLIFAVAAGEGVTAFTIDTSGTQRWHNASALSVGAGYTQAGSAPTITVNPSVADHQALLAFVIKANQGPPVIDEGAYRFRGTGSLGPVAT